MVNAYLIPVPFLLTMLYALVLPNGKNRHVGYVGGAAGILTLVLVWMAETASLAWFTLGDLTVTLSGMVDNVSLVMASVVAGIGILVFLYSVGYFEKKEDLRRYYALLSLFAWSMLGLVLAGNLVQLFFCWELVGVSSFLLIGFWHKRHGVRRSAQKAFLTILTGDVFFLMGIFVLAWQYGTFEITEILSALEPTGLTMLAGVGIIIGGISKSAQFPLHGWLADAMVGPTPVSAYLHSATMVKAGLFVIVRFLPLLVLVELTPWLTAIAVITIILSAIMALTATDIKRVLAYSTMNHLAFMLLAFSIGAVVAGMFHLVTHAIFKALLFFVAGVVIHTVGTQDLVKTKIKWAWTLVPVSALLGVATLAGVPPLAGFFSKDVIFEQLLHMDMVLVAIFGVAIILSAAYSFRWFFLIFGNAGRKPKSPSEMLWPLPVLALLSVVGGGLGLFLYPMWGETMPSVGPIALVSVLLVGLGVWIAYELYRKHSKMRWLTDSPLAEMGRQRFLMDFVYRFVAKVVMVLGRIASWFDDSVLSRIVRLIAKTFVLLSRTLRPTQTGNVQSYVAFFILGFVLLALAVGVFV